jgi:hypothetical protein
METEKYEEAVRDYETVSKLDKTSREYRYGNERARINNMRGGRLSDLNGPSGLIRIVVKVVGIVG